MITEIARVSMWRNSNYTRLLSAQVISLIGTGISSVCLALLAYDLAESDASTVLSFAFAIKMVAYIGLAPIFAVISRHWNKKYALISLDVIRASLFVTLPFVDQLWQVYVLMFAINACSAAFTPLYQATLPKVLTDKEDYTRALSYSRIAYDLEQILSPIISALLLTIISFRHLFWLDAITFIVSAVLLAFCVIPPDKSMGNVKNKRPSILNGLTAYLSEPKLRSLWYAYLAAAAASAMVIVNTVVYVHDVLHGGDTETALAMFFVGLGSMLVALQLPKWLSKHAPQRYHLWGMMLILIALYLGTWLPSWGGFGLMCFILGIGMSCIQTTSGLIINEIARDGDAGEYFAAHFSLTHLLWLFTYLAAGISASWFGMTGAYWVMFVIAGAGAVFYVSSIRHHHSIA